MNIIRNQKKSALLGTAAAAIVAPALLLVGSGTAQAAVPPDNVQYGGDLFGVGLTVTVTSDASPGSFGNCNYVASPTSGIGKVEQLPTYEHAFWLDQGQSVSWPVTSDAWGLPAMYTGTQWYVTVDCTDPNGVHKQSASGTTF